MPKQAPRKGLFIFLFFGNGYIDEMNSPSRRFVSLWKFLCKLFGGQELEILPNCNDGDIEIVRALLISFTGD